MKRRLHGKHRIRLGAFFFVSILALAGIGMSYASFHDVITIFGNVQTATVQFQDVTYDGTEIYENGNLVSFLDPIGYTNFESSEVAFGKGLEVDVECDNLINGNSYNAWINFTIDSIPMKIYDLDFFAIEGESWLDPLINDGKVHLNIYVDQNALPEPVLGSQIHPSEEISLHLIIDMTDDSMIENDENDEKQLEPLVVVRFDGKIRIKLEVIQWTGLCDDETPMPDPECQTETAWGGDTGVNVNDPGAWWYYYDTSGDVEQTIWAGQDINVGTVEVADGTVTIELTGDWDLQSGQETVKIQGYDSIDDLSLDPKGKPIPGMLSYKGNDISQGIFIGEYTYYAIHLDVQRCID
jgi:hypothetical protein